jgi:DNA-binding Lrp family transcriptional regulator
MAAPSSRARAADLPPALRRFLNLVGAFGPFVSLGQLGVTEVDLRRSLYRLERRGLVRRATLYDPSRLGQPVSCISLIQLGPHSQRALAELEAHCRSDASVTAACKVLGRFDYQVASSHADVRSAETWRKGIEALEAVAMVEMRFVRPIKGCGVAGLVILN